MQSQNRQNKGVVLNLPETITVANNSPLKQKLIKVLDAGYEKIILDFSSVEKIDISSLQILLSFYRESLKRKSTVSFAGTINPALEKQLTGCGFIAKHAGNDIYFFPFLENKGVKIGNR